MANAPGTPAVLPVCGVRVSLSPQFSVSVVRATLHFTFIVGRSSLLVTIANHHALCSLLLNCRLLQALAGPGSGCCCHAVARSSFDFTFNT